MRLITTLCLLTLTLNGLACTCDFGLKDKDLIKRADYAFIGEVISNVSLHPDSIVGMLLAEKGIKADAIIRVKRTLKGVLTTSEILVISSGNSCATEFTLGNSYLITGWTDSEKISPPIPEMSPPPDADLMSSEKESELEHERTRVDVIEGLSSKYFVLYTTECSSRKK